MCVRACVNVCKCLQPNWGLLRPHHVCARSKRVFLLGPSHYLGTRKCVLSSATEYVTPLGSLHIDQPVYDELRATGAFEVMELEPDETEHSMELHTPYIARIMGCGVR